MAPVATTRAWIPALQSLRGVAALWVVLYHVQVYTVFRGAPLLPLPGMRLGWLGVDLFFVLSAYLLGQPFIDGRSPTYRRFMTDRFLRIAPAYYAAFLAAILLYVLFAPDAWTPGKAVWTLLFLQNHEFQSFLAVNPAFWSLAVEMQFYLVLPFLARRFRGPRWPWTLAICVAVSLLYRGILYQMDTTEAYQLEAMSLPGFLGHFALGLAAARIRLLDNPVGSGTRRATFIAGFALVVIPAALWVPAGSIYFSVTSLEVDMLLRVVAGCGFALMVLATASGGWVAKALAVRPLQWLGGISYSLYLMHIPVQVVLMQVLDPTEDPWSWAVSATLLSLFSGWLLYVTVEAPAEAWRRRRKVRQRALRKAQPATAG
jgi:peptidoglycan/LPS O-acetylase OafA/YrhL